MKRILIAVLIMVLSGVCIADNKSWYSFLQGSWNIETISNPDGKVLWTEKAYINVGISDEGFYLDYSYGDDTVRYGFATHLDVAMVTLSVPPHILEKKDYYIVTRKKDFLMMPEIARDKKAKFIYYRLYR
jgi:hypothetical protein